MRVVTQTLALFFILALSSCCTSTCPGSCASPAPDLAPVADLAKPHDMSMGPVDMACRIPCDFDGKCPAAIWGVCVAGCCICMPPDGGMCPMTVREVSLSCQLRSDRSKFCAQTLQQTNGGAP